VSEKPEDMEHYCLLAVEQDFALREPYIPVRRRLVEMGLIGEYVIHRLTPEGERALGEYREQHVAAPSQPTGEPEPRKVNK
jgi:hypothetical protein